MPISAGAGVVHFATHGLVAGETALFAENRAEPALLLTPVGRKNLIQDIMRLADKRDGGLRAQVL